MIEQWANIPGFDTRYFASSLGRIKSLVRRKEKFLSCRIDKGGYLRVSLAKREMLVHRVIALAFLPNPEDKRTVNHKNSIRSDNRLENLEWATHSENEFHSYRSNGRVSPLKGKFGENHPRHGMRYGMHGKARHS